MNYRLDITLNIIYITLGMWFNEISINLELSLTFMFNISMQVVPSIAMVETYTRLLLISPHSLFRSHFSVISCAV